MVSITAAEVSPSANPGELNITLSCAQGTDPREAVSSACIAAGIPILMMKSADVSLEQIFLEVTGDDAPAETAAPDETPEEPGKEAEDQ